MSVRLTKWGNSTGLRLASVIMEAAGLKVGDRVNVRLLNEGEIRVRPVKRVVPAEPDGASGTNTPAPDQEGSVW
jgi:antitoxin MazE